MTLHLKFTRTEVIEHRDYTADTVTAIGQTIPKPAKDLATRLRLAAVDPSSWDVRELMLQAADAIEARGN
jgi:hypothetical protein